MKRITTLFLLFVLCLSAFSAQGMGARYHAEITVDFHLRESPKEGGKRIALINEGIKVVVSEYGDKWSKIIINQGAGYAKSKWLSKFIALDPFANPVPGHQRQIGIATNPNDKFHIIITVSYAISCSTAMAASSLAFSPLALPHQKFVAVIALGPATVEFCHFLILRDKSLALCV